MSTSPVLSVKDLNVRFNTENGIVHAVRLHGNHGSAPDYR